MIQLQNDSLIVSFPKVHAEARLTIDFQRTLRIPDDDTDYALPPGLGRFPVRLVDDFAEAVPRPWLRHGGVMLPMYQSEAMWLNFGTRWIGNRQTSYPFAIKIAAGKINAVSGDPWSETLRRGPQDYVVAPEQPWLDGFSVEKGVIRQFVAMPLGSGFSAEEQVTGKAEFGGLQLLVLPMKGEVFERRFPRVELRVGSGGSGIAHSFIGSSSVMADMACEEAPFAAPDMGLAPGGRMRQEIYDDPFSLDDWDHENASRCFVHLTNSMVWRAITGAEPPTVPPTAREYTRAGLPWFDYYSETSTAMDGSQILARLKSVKQKSQETGMLVLPENVPVTPERIIEIRRGLARDQVREGTI